MIAFIDTSVLVAAMVATETHHARCARLLDKQTMGMFAHGLAETFSTLTGGRRAFRMSSLSASTLIEEDYAPCLSITTLTPTEMLRAMREAESRGVRGGGIFDYLHLVAARKAGAAKFYTLNMSNFSACHRSGDPEIVSP